MTETEILAKAAQWSGTDYAIVIAAIAASIVTVGGFALTTYLQLRPIRQQGKANGEAITTLAKDHEKLAKDVNGHMTQLMAANKAADNREGREQGAVTGREIGILEGLATGRDQGRAAERGEAADRAALPGAPTPATEATLTEVRDRLPEVKD